MWRDADRRRGIRQPSDMASFVILGIETSCDETAAAVVTARRRVLSSVVASQADLHARYGGVVPEIASRRHLELVAPVIRAALEDAGVALGRRRPRRRHAGAGPRRRAARRALGREGARVGARPPARPRRPPARPRRDALPRAGPARAAVHVPARERGAHARARRCATGRGFERARLDARRRGGRGVRQGRAAARPRLPRRRRDRPSRARGRPRALPVPRRPRARARPLVLRAQDRAALRGARPARGELARARADLAASYQRAIVRALVGRLRAARRADRATRRSPSSAASPPTPSCAARCPRRASPRSPSARTTRR